VVFPVGRMLVVSLVGGGTALLGVLRPARDLYRLDLAQTLRPRFVEQQGLGAAARRTSGVTLIALPFMLLVYILMRPFFRNALPSFTFFVLEAGFVCVAFLLTLVLVPELVRRGGGLLVRLLPRGPAAERLLTQRRIEHLGHELSWSVSGVMLVFALLLSLHVVTYALTAEVSLWAAHAVEPYAYLFTPREAMVIPPLTGLPPGVAEVRFTGRTPWPNSVYAAAQADLARLAAASGRPELVQKAGRLGPGKALLSKMMARRLRVREGDELEVAGRGGTARLAVAVVTDDLGYMPMAGPYRNSKTYAILDTEDDGLITPYCGPLGAAVALADDGHPGTIPDFRALFDKMPAVPGARMLTGLEFEKGRIIGTDNDFLVFDLILALTSVLAAVGIANQMVLSVHARRRELALYRVLGMTARQVRRMILFEGAFIGLFGGGLAVLLGIPLGYAAIGALRAVSAFEVDFTLPPHYAVLTLAGAVVVALAASLHPAASAGKTDSAESVHYE
jgi:putative ABC transport system permease protein